MRNFGMFLFFITALFYQSIKEKNHPICGRYNAESTKIAEFNEPSDKVKKLLCDFLQRSNQGNKPEKSFFNWGRVRAFDNRITYRTYQRTVFKNYKKHQTGIITSLD